MDQNIERKIYVNRVENSCNALSEQLSGNMKGGKIIGGDGTSFMKVNGRLVQVIDTPEMKKSVKRVLRTVKEQGLVSGVENAQESAMVESVATEFASGM